MFGPSTRSVIYTSCTSCPSLFCRWSFPKNPSLSNSLNCSHVPRGKSVSNGNFQSQPWQTPCPPSPRDFATCPIQQHVDYNIPFKPDNFATHPFQQHVDCSTPFKPDAVALLAQQRSARQSMPATALMPRQCRNCPNNAMSHLPPSSSHPATNASPTPQNSRCPLPNSTTPFHHDHHDNAAAPPLPPRPFSLTVVPRPRPLGTPIPLPLAPNRNAHQPAQPHPPCHVEGKDVRRHQGREVSAPPPRTLPAPTTEIFLKRVRDCHRRNGGQRWQQ